MMEFIKDSWEVLNNCILSCEVNVSYITFHRINCGLKDTHCIKKKKKATNHHNCGIHYFFESSRTDLGTR